LTDEDVRAKLERTEKKTICHIGQIAEAFGIKGLKQEILGALCLAAGDPVSLTETIEMTHFSKASVSRAVRELQMEIPLIETVKKPSDRERDTTG